MQLEILTLSSAGGRQVNEDACGIWSSDHACFCVLSDGAGGHGGGDVASKLVVSSALDWFRAHPECSSEAVGNAISAANRSVVEQQGRDPRLSDMRATALVLAINTWRDVACWGHLGDSRLYCFRQSRIIAQTRDHSVVQSMVDAGYMKSQDLRAAPERSKLLAALGDESNFEPSIEANEFLLSDGDIFLLCTDGFWEYLDEREMEEALSASSSCQEWLKSMEDKVMARGSSSQDNYSAIVLACSDSSDVTLSRTQDNTLSVVRG